MNDDLLKILVCPKSGGKLEYDNCLLYTSDAADE